MDYKICQVKPETTIKEIIEIFNKAATQIALIMNQDRLIGVVTDGDLRRGLLKGEDLTKPVKNIMISNYKFLKVGASKSDALQMMKKENLRHVPIVDEKKIFFDLYTLDELASLNDLDNDVVIMAGGRGKRLMPLTKECPKPMIKAGGVPILEIIINQCINSGLNNFFISVNYLKEQIKDYFGDGAKWGVKINYLEENSPLGTAGSISLLPYKPKKPILVLNGDVVTNVDFLNLINFHIHNDSDITCCVKKIINQIPYGILELEGIQVKSLKEKPIVANYINAGVYLLNANLIDLIPKNKYFDFTNFLELLIKKNFKLNAFPLHEYWQDIGNIENLIKTRSKLYSDKKKN